MASSSVLGPKRLPLVAIVGATGTGKSQLAVDIATRFNGEIINGDAMQLYQGLPIITNKMPVHERNGIPHHLLGCIGLEEPTWTVGQFVSTALEIIKDIRDRGRLPVLVGGTHYYTQALLFKDQIIDQGESPREQTFPILQESTEVILAKLREVDPAMADRWHPNDRRKIQRSLEICLKTGKPASQIYAEQQTPAHSANTDDSDDINESPLDGSPSLIDQTLVFWVHATTETLRDRLDSRVLDMVRSGLMEEVQTLDDFLRVKESTGEIVDRTRGIWVSIGYKEFEAYQNALRSCSITEDALQKLKQEGIERTQAATRQYSKRQVRWIRIKLLNALSRAGASKTTFLLDGSHINQWHKTVAEPAIEVTRHFLNDETLPDPPSLSEAAREMLSPKSEDLSQRPDLWEKKTCEACGIVAVTPATWDMHLKSRGHKRATTVRAPQQFPLKESKLADIPVPALNENP